MHKIRTGIIGGGFIGAHHVEAIRRLGYVDVIALAGSTLASARASAAELYIERAYGTYEELLADRDIDVVHNCTPNVLHYAINRAALEAGKHVISEKPLAMHSAETAYLVEIARKSNRLAAVNFNHRGYPMVQQMRAMISGEQLGTVQLLHGSYLQDWLLYPTDWSWRLDPAIGGASRAVTDIGSHWTDLIQHVTGQRIIRVCADLQTVLPKRKRPTASRQTFGGSARNDQGEDGNITTEDYASILFATDQGAHGVCTVSQVSAGHKNRLVFEVNGSHASARWDADIPNDLWIGYRDKANEVLSRDPSLVAPGVQAYTHLPGGHAEAWPDALKNVMAEIYTAIVAGHTEPTATDTFASFYDGHRSALFVDAILESAQRGTWVAVREA